MQMSEREELEAEERRSLNEKKRLASQAVRRGMDLAALADSQIKCILKAANAEPELFEAIALVKRFGSDVRVGKRRQFNYIGQLLRGVDLCRRVNSSCERWWSDPSAGISWSSVIND